MDQTYTLRAYRFSIYCFSSWSAQFSLIDSTIHHLLQGNTQNQILISMRTTSLGLLSLLMVTFSWIMFKSNGINFYVLRTLLERKLVWSSCICDQISAHVNQSITKSTQELYHRWMKSNIFYCNCFSLDGIGDKS